MQREEEALDEIIKNKGQFDALMKKRRDNSLYKKVIDGKIEVDHVATANAIIKFIMLVPMDRWVKKVMIMRIGDPTKQKKPMSSMAVALALGMTEDEVIEAEEYGKKVVGDFMQRVTAPEFVEKFNREKSLEAQVKEIQSKTVNPQDEAT